MVRKRSNTIFMKSIFLNDVSSSGVVQVGDVAITAPIHQQLLSGGPRGAASFSVQENPKSFTRLHYVNQLSNDPSDMNITPESEFVSPPLFGEQQHQSFHLTPPSPLNHSAQIRLQKAKNIVHAVDFHTTTKPVQLFGHLEIHAITNSACLLIGNHDFVIPQAQSYLIGVLPSAVSAAPGVIGPVGPVGAIR